MLKRAQVEAKVLKRMTEDPGFRDRLLANPRATLEAEFKLFLSPAVRITLHEDSAETLHIVLPSEDAAVRAAAIAPLVADDRHPTNRMQAR
ncbi:MAG TPA: hypothetical protein VGE72_05395 [Azospirillum sp.]